jgi:hypothetical protein
MGRTAVTYGVGEWRKRELGEGGGIEMGGGKPQGWRGGGGGDEEKKRNKKGPKGRVKEKEKWRTKSNIIHRCWCWDLFWLR